MESGSRLAQCTRCYHNMVADWLIFAPLETEDAPSGAWYSMVPTRCDEPLAAGFWVTTLGRLEMILSKTLADS